MEERSRSVGPEDSAEQSRRGMLGVASSAVVLVAFPAKSAAHHQFAVIPPSITSSLPVTHDASSEAR
jgi:hypothetical protein